LRFYIVRNVKGVKLKMDDRINITKKLVSIVKNRKTPIVVNKQKSGYNKNKGSGRSLSYDSYSNDNDY